MDDNNDNGGDVGARVIAARAYARLTQDELAEKVRDAGFRFSRRTLDRLEAGERHLDVREARVIAQTCGVPLGFLVRGFWAPADLADRVAALEDQFKSAALDRDALAQQIESLGGSLENRLVTYARQALEQALQQAPAKDRSTAE
jgi:transcriptional regulator with XRE-family HTH domain